MLSVRPFFVIALLLLTLFVAMPANAQQVPETGASSTSIMVNPAPPVTDAAAQASQRVYLPMIVTDRQQAVSPNNPPTPAAPTPTPPPAEPTMEDQVVALTNAERSAAGCAPVTIDVRLTNAAQAHADDMATQKYFSHTSKDGREFWERIDSAGYPWSRVAENIAYGYRSPQAVTNGWMDSQGHRENMLNCKLTDIGIGYNQDGHYWVMNLGRQ